MKVSCVFLARTDSEISFGMTTKCIQSAMESEPNVEFEIIIVESNKEYYTSTFIYPNFVKVIIPQEQFNFHQFLNIGIQQATGNYIALCNNDLIFHKNWFTEILKISNLHPEILSFSPKGIPNISTQEAEYQIGYKVTQQLKGWCIVVKPYIFKKIGALDETFSFFYADNDYGMTLKYYNIKHALVFNSYVEHLEKKTKPKTKSILNEAFIKKYNIPNYLLKDQFHYLYQNENDFKDFMKFHNKWGSYKLLYRKNKIADLLLKYNLGYLNRFFLKIKF
jgi:glycosyltransferase involved in cell wall biosynthesis